MEERLDISKYLLFLTNQGWSDLIDSWWKVQVYQELVAKYPNMSEPEWKQIENVLFI